MVHFVVCEPKQVFPLRSELQRAIRMRKLAERDRDRAMNEVWERMCLHGTLALLYFGERTVNETTLLY